MRVVVIAIIIIFILPTIQCNFKVLGYSVHQPPPLGTPVPPPSLGGTIRGLLVGRLQFSPKPDQTRVDFILIKARKRLFVPV